MTANEPVAWTDGKGNYFDKNSFFPVDDLIPLYTHPVKELDEQFKKGFEAGKEEGWKAHKFHHPVKELTDEVWSKAFDFYCETDEGVLKFDFELRDEWKKEQLIRWKEALRKAQEK